MSTTQPQGQPLTRKQLRELHDAAATPSPALPAAVPLLPNPDPVTPLSRREVREQDRLRAVPVTEVPSAPAAFAQTAAPAAFAALPVIEEPESRSALRRRRDRGEYGLAAPIVPDALAAQSDDLSRRGASREPVPPVSSQVAVRAVAAPPAVAPRETASLADTTGSQHVAPTALIFNRPPDPLTLSGPITSTGELLVTGVLALPASVGSRGHAPGTTDGKDIDAGLVDAELAVNSSPAPVAASSAISTIRPTGEVMRQPAPEKQGKLIMGLAITVGGLMIALSVALILAFTSGIF